jgi:hypothetical protein
MYFNGRGIVAPFFTTDIPKKVLDHKAVLIEKIESGQTLDQIMVNYRQELRAMEIPLEHIHCVEQSDASRIWGTEYEKNMEKWCLYILVLIKLGALRNDDLNGYYSTWSLDGVKLTLIHEMKK